MTLSSPSFCVVLFYNLQLLLLFFKLSQRDFTAISANRGGHLHLAFDLFYIHLFLFVNIVKQVKMMCPVFWFVCEESRCLFLCLLCCLCVFLTRADPYSVVMVMFNCRCRCASVSSALDTEKTKQKTNTKTKTSDVLLTVQVHYILWMI